MSDISRRGLLGAGAAGVILAPIAVPAEATAAHKKKRRQNLYARSRFKPLRTKRFTLTGRGHSTPVRLVKISNLRSSGAGDERRFALTFRSTRTGPEQGSYTLRRKGFTATTLFVVPDVHRRSYQAVVNRAP
jgi:hypothetical protein